MKHDMAKEMEGVNPDDLVHKKENRYISMLIETIPIILMLAAFIVYGIIIWSNDYERAYAKRITIDKDDFNQGIFVGLAYALFFSYCLMAVWFRLFQLYNYQAKPMLLLLAIVSYAAIVVIGVIYGSVVMNDVDGDSKTAIITAFCVFPLYILTIWIFYGIWRHNHYNIYSGAKLTRVQRTGHNEESGAELAHDGGENERRKKPKVNISKTNYHLMPNSFNDCVIAIVFWLNIIGLFAGFLVCVIVYDPAWVIAFIWAWAMLLEFTLFGIIRLYFAGFS